MLLCHTAVAARACAGGEQRQAPVRATRSAPAPDVAEQHPSRRMLLGAGAALILTRGTQPAQAAAGAPAPQRAAAVPNPASQRAAAPAAAPARTGPPMAGPPQSILALGYAAVAGVGLLFVTQQGSKQADEYSAAFPAETPSPLAAALTAPGSGPLAIGVAAADKWRADAAKEYEVRAIAARKRQIESEWFAAYNEKLRNDIALKAQVSRSAASQVERNKAIRAKASSEAVDQDVAPPGTKKRGILSVLGSLIPFRKKK